MPSPTVTGGPVSQRVVGVDVARGVALIGVIIANVLPEQDPNGEPLLAWTLVAGRAAALFALIAGISIALQSGGPHPPTGRAMTAARAALVVRALMITGIGLVLGSADPPVTGILPYYGFLFLLAVPMLGLGRRALVMFAVVFAVVGPVTMQLVHLRWPDLPQIDGEYTLGLAAAHPGLFLTDMLLTGFYPALPWAAYICVGLAVGRLNLSSRKVATVLLGAGTALATLMWVASTLLLGPAGGLHQIVATTPGLDRTEIDDILVYGGDATDGGLPTTTGWWLAINAPYSSTPVTLLHTLGIALAVLGAVLLLAPYLGRATAPLAAAGSMTLTLYSAHLVILAMEILDPERPVMSVVIQIVVFLLAAVLWRTAIGKGPLENILATTTAWLRDRILTGRLGPGPPG